MELTTMVNEQSIVNVKLENDLECNTLKGELCNAEGS